MQKFSQCFDLSPPKKPTLGHTQNIHQKTSIPEHRCITNQTPQPFDEFKVLPPQFTGVTTGRNTRKKKYGIYHTPEQFRKKGHFHDASVCRPGPTLLELLTKGRSHVAAQRLDFAKKLACCSKELVTGEARYLATLPQHAQRKRSMAFTIHQSNL
jgi:hypothetical protein